MRAKLFAVAAATTPVLMASHVSAAPAEENAMKVSSKEELTTFAIGNPNDAYAQYFIGQSYLNPYQTDKSCGVSNVTFEPSCRNNWHIHHKAPQILVVVAGEGIYQEWGKDPVLLKPGMVVNIPPEVKHWHGATADSWMQHLSIAPAIEGASNEWLEQVDDAAFAQANTDAK